MCIYNINLIYKITKIRTHAFQLISKVSVYKSSNNLYVKRQQMRIIANYLMNGEIEQQAIMTMMLLLKTTLQTISLPLLLFVFRLSVLFYIVYYTYHDYRFPGFMAVLLMKSVATYCLSVAQQIVKVSAHNECTKK